MKKQRQHKKTTRPKTRRRPELFTGPVRSSNDKRQHKTTQDTRTTTRTGKHPDSEKKKRAMKTRDFFFFRTSRGKRVLVGAIERVGCGTSLEQKGATRGSMRSRSTSDKRSEDERETNEPLNINKRFHEVEIDKRQEKRRRARNE